MRLGCTCDKITKGQPFKPGDCPHCHAYWHDAATNRDRGGDGKVIPLANSQIAAASAALPCSRRGLEVIETVPCKTCSLKTLDVYACTLHGKCTIHEIPKDTPDNLIERCADCDDRDAKYDPWKNLVKVIPPPALSLSPTSARAVVTTATGKDSRELHAISRPWMEAYAARLGADFVVLDWPGHPRWPMSCKFATARALDHYERIIYLDADTMADPETCPDLFELTPPDTFGACDELVWHVRKKHPLEAEYHRQREVMGYPRIELDWYVNAGVFVAGKSHQHCLEAPEAPIPPLHCAEQHWINAKLRETGNITFLPRTCNWQRWTSAPDFSGVPENAIKHFNSLSNADRAVEMRRLAANSLTAS